MREPGTTLRETWIKDRAFCFLAACDDFVRGVGVSTSELIGHADDRFFPARMVSFYRKDDTRAALLGRRLVVYEPGVKFPWVTTKTPIRHHGRVVAVRGVALAWSLPNIRECLGVPGLDGPARSKSGWLDDARGRIEGDFRERLVIHDLAGEYGLRADSVGRAFKRAFGIGIPTLIRRLRVSWCMMEIAEGGDLSAVAISAGFADQSHMTRAFQQELGISPGEIARRP